MHVGHDEASYKRDGIGLQWCGMTSNLGKRTKSKPENGQRVNQKVYLDIINHEMKQPLTEEEEDLHKYSS